MISLDQLPKEHPHCRLEVLWVQLVGAAIDLEKCMIHLDGDSYRDLLLLRDSWRVGSSQHLDVDGKPRWRGIQITIHYPKDIPLEDFRRGHGMPKSTMSRMPLLISIQYQLKSGRICYLDDDDNTPFWRKGMIAEESSDPDHYDSREN